MEILITVFVVIEVTTCAIVIWETISNKSIVDVIWNIIFKDGDSNE